jgi:putative endopeptidase
MRLFQLVLSSAITCVAFVAVGQEKATQSSIVTPDHFDLKEVDTSVDPCVDFYEYACKKWQATNPIPPDQASWSHGAKLVLWNQHVLLDLLEKAAVNDPKRNPVQQKIGDYYSSCMEEAAINTKGIAVLKPELDRINRLHSKNELAGEISHLHEITFALDESTDSGAKTVAFGFASQQDFDDASKVVAFADQGGLGLPDRDYYLKEDAESAETRKQYQAHVQKMFQLTGEAPGQARADSKTVLDMETALAKSSMDIVKRRDPANLNHKLTAQQLRALTPSFSWDDYLKLIGAPPTAHYLLLTPDFYKGLEQLIAGQSLASWKTYLRWHLVHDSASVLGEPLVQENFNFYGQKLLGQKQIRPRWRRCVSYVDRDLGEALGQAYVERAFGPESKQRMLKMVHALETALGNDIEQVDWMTSATRQEAIAKLKKIEDKIGYPNKWRDYSSLNIVRGDALGNVYRSSEFELRRQLARIGKPVDRGEWLMTPPTVNAYYDPQLNTINFPAGILQPPFFDNDMEDAVNFGAIGAVIGHELTHGFDDEGRKFDADGNLRDWWTEQDAKQFEQRVQCIADEYSGFEATPGLKLNGNLTLGENTADNGGARIALMALESALSSDRKSDEKPGAALTPQQMFFVSYGQSWCANDTPQMLRLMAQSDPHSTPKYRVNGVLSNMPQFQKAFACKPGQPMVRANACRVW